MKKVHFILLLAAVLAICGTQKAKAQNVVLNNFTDTVSYMIGADIAKSFQTSNIEVDSDVFFAGFHDVFVDKTNRFTEEQILAVLERFQKEIQQNQEVVFSESQAADINVEALKEPCDFADAQLIIVKEMKEIADANKDVKDEKDLKKEDQEKVEMLMGKMIEIAAAQEQAQIKEEDMNKCDSYKEMEIIMDEMDQ